MITLKKNYETLTDAFEALPESTKKHCERVASYTRTIFLSAVDGNIYPSDQKVTARLREEYGEIAYTAGLYHDIGKVYLPAELHFDIELDETEQMLYRKHIGYSYDIAAALLREETGFNAYETAYALEAIKSLHENWDGSGLPEGLAKRKIPIIARILKIADALDNGILKRHSETPFEEALEDILKGADTLYDPEITDILNDTATKLKKIYKQSGGYDKQIPAIDAFVARKEKRPVKLEYRAMVDRETSETVALEARPVFFVKKMKIKKDYGYVEQLIKQDKKLLRDLCIYMVTEACDTLRHADAGGLDIGYIVLNLPTGWLKNAGAAKEILAVIKDEEIEPKRLCIIADEIAFSGARANLYKNAAALNEAGVRVMASDVELVATEKTTEAAPVEETTEDISTKTKKRTPKEEIPVTLSTDDFTANGFNMFRMCARDEERADDNDYIAMVKALEEKGAEILADNLDGQKLVPTMKLLNVKTVSGALHGDYMLEDDIIKAGLALKA